MPDPRFQQGEILIKSLQDEVDQIRAAFELGLECRNTGARMRELAEWRNLRAAIEQAQIHLADMATVFGGVL